MTTTSRTTGLTLLGVCLLFTSACAAAMQIHSFTETGADLRRYSTFAFAPVGTTTTGDPRLDDNPFFNDRVRQNVEQQLTAHGFRKATGTADLVVHHHASVSQEISIDDRPRPECLTGTTLNGTQTTPSANCRPYVYDAGTLLVDLVDRRTGKVVWRGWAEGSIDGVLENQEWMEQHIDEAVTKIMARLPRSTGRAGS